MFNHPRQLVSMAQIAYGLCEFCCNPLGKIDDGAMDALLQQKPFSLTCLNCDAQCDEPHEALLSGWRNITDDDGPSWNFLGFCPVCAPECAFLEHELAAEIEALNIEHKQGMLF